MGVTGELSGQKEPARGKFQKPHLLTVVTGAEGTTNGSWRPHENRGDNISGSDRTGVVSVTLDLKCRIHVYLNKLIH